jgi:hypothetical protein
MSCVGSYVRSNKRGRKNSNGTLVRLMHACIAKLYEIISGHCCRVGKNGMVTLVSLSSFPNDLPAPILKALLLFLISWK